MIRFFTNRQMATRLDIKLSRWKRWSREFLPPDPIGGLQSGLARQYTVAEAFTVYLGGYIVAHLNFSIPEARCILSDLKPCLISLGFLTGTDQQRSPSETFSAEIKAHHIRIWRLAASKSDPTRFGYQLRQRLTTVRTDRENPKVKKESLLVTRFDEQKPGQLEDEPISWRTLDIGFLHRRFSERISTPVA